jgi:hypothetical protein
MYEQDCSDKPITILGQDYISVSSFAKRRNKSISHIMRLIREGNSVRKLRVVYVDNKPMVALAELDEFPWTPTGPNAGDRAHPYKE